MSLTVDGQALIYTNEFGITSVHDLFHNIPAKTNTKKRICKGTGLLTLGLDKSGQFEFIPINAISKAGSKIAKKIVPFGNDGVYISPDTLVPIEHSSKVVRIPSDNLKPNNHILFPLDSSKIGKLHTEYQTVAGGNIIVCSTCKKVILKHPVSGKCNECGGKLSTKIKAHYRLSEDLAYLTGLVLTDGHINHKKYSISITSITKELLEEAKRICDSIGFSNGKVVPEYNYFKFRINSKELVYLLEHIGIFSVRKSYTQSLPTFITSSPYSVICAFVAGVIDGDGHIRVKVTKSSITSASKAFSYHMCMLMNSVGICCTLRKRKKYQDRAQVYDCMFSALPKAVADRLVHPTKRQRSEFKVKTRRYKAIKKIIGTSCSELYTIDIKNENSALINGFFIG